MATPTEPTYTDKDGKERPGAGSLVGVINPTTMAQRDAMWQEFYKELKNRNLDSSQFPNIRPDYAPLDSLINMAFQRFGNMSPDTIDGQVRMMMLGYANRIVEDIRIHPYSSIPDLDYYHSLTDWRPIADEIMISGLMFYYSLWMDSAKMPAARTLYYSTMNSILFQRKYGAGKIEMNTVDKDEVK